MRYLAIDYGLKRVGLAICDAGERLVSPLAQVGRARRHPERLLRQISDIASEHGVEAIVVGLPVNMDDSEGAQAKLTRHFADELSKSVALPVHLQDERLSSSAAAEKLRGSGLSRAGQKARRDMLAACEILQEFLDRKRGE